MRKTMMAGVLAVALTTGTVVTLATASATQDKVTICHAAGRAGTTKYVELTLAYNAVYGQAGHFSEPGTPNAGHEDDYEGQCQPEETTTTEHEGTTTTEPEGTTTTEHEGTTTTEPETTTTEPEGTTTTTEPEQTTTTAPPPPDVPPIVPPVVPPPPPAEPTPYPDPPYGG